MKETKRVEIYGIEFNWILNETEGKAFLKELSESDNLELFSIGVIKAIIAYMWSFYQRDIIKNMLIPYMFYFTTFIL